MGFESKVFVVFKVCSNVFCCVWDFDGLGMLPSWCFISCVHRRSQELFGSQGTVWSILKVFEVWQMIFGRFDSLMIKVFSMFDLTNLGIL